MDVEIFLDCSEAAPENMLRIEQGFQRWFNEGAEIRPNKISFNSLTPLEGQQRYLVNLGYADPIAAFRNLHARLRNLGVKVFLHFIY
ncbi:hypothetical protein ACOHYD_01325 [Desulfobacterota bacterium M19]